MRGFVYLLKNQENRHYVGSTTDILRRIEEHKRKHANSKFTKNGNFELVGFREFNTLSEARIYEKKIKTSRTERIKFYNSIIGA